MGIFDWISGKEKFQKDTLQLGENCFRKTLVKIYKMKKQILIIFIAIYCQSGFTQNGDANSLEFDLNYKVTDQVVLTIKDGTAKRYSKYDDGPAIGEIFRLKFNFEYSQNSYKLNITTPNAAVGGFRIVLNELKSWSH